MWVAPPWMLRSGGAVLKTEPMCCSCCSEMPVGGMESPTSRGDPSSLKNPGESGR